MPQEKRILLFDQMLPMLIPSNISSFYSNAIDKAVLFQGDIIRADGVGLKELNRDCDPDYWMIITKNCDLAFIESKLPRKQNISIVPLFTINRASAPVIIIFRFFP